ncbi:glycosyltransferase [Wenyingzhuangia sp. chi5]|uniref:Glycosyltransferase n=1 Tax=Wenyingzhuangia gilva TaxID=3057677 RepID=A0ABT8VNS5_9FLAO|nr:glycosyltransferase [Wenyingzhuangia sp. chi5]MDO3693628.1 glycosyltransferase [Wenyingzhuangia sp. chi5]
MKVIHVVGSLDISAGGPSRSVPQSCEALSKLGVDIEIYTRPSKNPVKVNTTAKFKVSFKTIFKLFKDGMFLSKDKVDLIHLQHVWDPYIHVMALIARIKGIPYIITPRGMLEPWIMNNNPWKKRIAMFLYQKRDLKLAEAIHATCTLERDNIHKLGFNNTEKIIPNGIVLDEVKDVKKTFGTKKIVFLSRIHPKKGIELLIDAWEQIQDIGWSIEIAGDGNAEYIKNLKKDIEVKKIKGISFVGSKYGETKWDFIRSADIFILPTYSENFGIVVAEALAVGVPAITTMGTPWEELNEFHCGKWIDLSVENIKNTILELSSLSSDQLKKMGENGIELINNKYTISSVGSAIFDMYKRVLKNK